jgi:predicted PurR-regulated permease PerM
VTEHIRRAGQVAWAVVGLALMLVVVGILAWTVRVIFPPLILAGAIVFVLNPVVSWLQRRGLHRALGTLVTYVGIVVVLAGVGFGLRPVVAHQVEELRDHWPEVRDKVNRWVDDRAAASKGKPYEFTREELYDFFSTGNRSLGEQVERVRDLGVRVFHVLLILVLGPVLAFYLLVDLPHLRRVAEGLVPPRARAEVMVVARRLNQAIGGFFRGQLLVAFLVGVLCSVGLAVIGLPFWLLIGMIAGLFNMIPLVGPWIGGVPGVVVALTTREPITAVWVVVIMVAAQQIDNHFITPTVMHRTVKLHPAAVILALVAGGTLAGFAGLLLAVPTAAVLKILASHLWRVHVLGEPLEAWDAEMEAAARQAGVGFVERVPAGAGSEGTDVPPGDAVGTTASGGRSR